MKRIIQFVEELAVMEVPPNVFNQYSYQFQENSTRRENLLIYLNQMYQLKPKVLLVGEAPGYRGCRLTGVPFTSEHLLMHNLDGLKLFGRENGYKLASKKPKLLKEATATIIWSTLVEHHLIALGWNAFPFHPHKKDNPTSNRAPLKKELELGQKPLLQIIELFDIKKIIAVGNKAEENLNLLGISCNKVRHPAQGGKNDFVKGMKELLSAL
ncbi:MAG: uracil-DNA glycosylase [Epulopiscium sp.]|nr:uracil-DNA glycosylase [Candidatus Epulonipiscium sp.]